MATTVVDITTTITAGITVTLPVTTATAAVPGTPSGGISSAAAGGVALSCIVAGIAIGSFASILLARKRRGHQQGGKDRQQHSAATARELPLSRHCRQRSTASCELPLSKTEPPPPRQPRRQRLDDRQSSFNLDLFLLDRTPDSDIQFELSTLGQLIESHVDKYYHRDPVSVEVREMADALRQLGFRASAPPFSADCIAPLVLDPRTRKPALRHVLSFVLFSSIDLDSARQNLPVPSILPPPMVDFVRASQSVAGQSGDAEANARAANQWRVLSAYLLHSMRRSRSALAPPETALAPLVKIFEAATSSVLGLFSRPGQAEHLRAAAKRAAKLGYILLSQPSEWRFEHTVEPRQDPGGKLVVVCAGLSRLACLDGEKSSSGSVMVQAPECQWV